MHVGHDVGGAVSAGRIVELGLLAQSSDPGKVFEEEAADDLSGSGRSDLAAPVLAHLADWRLWVIR